MEAAVAVARERNRSTPSKPALNNAGVVYSPVETLARRGRSRDNTLDTINPPVDQKTGSEEGGDIVFTGESGSLKKKQCSGSSDDSQKKKRFLGFSGTISSKSKGGHRNVASKSIGRTGMFTEEPIGERGEFQVSSGAVDRVRDIKTPTSMSKLTIG